MTTAAQICRRVAFTSRLKFEEQNQHRKLKKVALTLSHAVMEFWHSAEVLLNNKDANLGPKNRGHGLAGSRVNEVTENKTAEFIMVLVYCWTFIDLYFLINLCMPLCLMAVMMTIFMFNFLINTWC